MEDTALFAICKGGYCTAGNLSRRILHCGNLFLREETALLVIFFFEPLNLQSDVLSTEVLRLVTISMLQQ